MLDPSRGECTVARRLDSLGAWIGNLMKSTATVPSIREFVKMGDVSECHLSLVNAKLTPVGDSHSTVDCSWCCGDSWHPSSCRPVRWQLPLERCSLTV